VNAELATQLEARRAPRPLTWRLRLVTLLGPLAALAGIAWAIAQPYRLTFLHPHGQGFWWLVVEPPLLVIATGLLFHLAVVRGLLEDLERP
jgi:hypothetical protein